MGVYRKENLEILRVQMRYFEYIDAELIKSWITDVEC